MPGLTSSEIRRDLLDIWNAGTGAVNTEFLVRSHIQVDDAYLSVGNSRYELSSIHRILVVGAGKAAAAAARGLEKALGEELLERKKVHGRVNVPEGTGMPTTHVQVQAVRPVAVNEPTDKAVASTEEILRLVAESDPDDLCIVLITGGGSALMTAPAEGVSLADKIAVTRLLSSSGANIQQLNSVRRRISRVKGGGLLRHCSCRRVVTLIVSDVLGDPVEMIASGPTTPAASTEWDARNVLLNFDPDRHQVPHSVWECVETAPPVEPLDLNHRCQIIGNLDIALRAAAGRATALGYDVLMAKTDNHEPAADEVARRVFDTLNSLQPGAKPLCWINGGEPTVELAAAEIRGKGGRNQQLVVALLSQLIASAARGNSLAARVGFVSAGTDGEDGPTDAAGGMLWPDLSLALACADLNLQEYLDRNDTYHLLGPLAALVRTGPTHTNVCDLRVAIVTADG